MMMPMKRFRMIIVPKTVDELKLGAGQVSMLAERDGGALFLPALLVGTELREFVRCIRHEKSPQ